MRRRSHMYQLNYFTSRDYVSDLERRCQQHWIADVLVMHYVVDYCCRLWPVEEQHSWSWVWTTRRYWKACKTITLVDLSLMITAQRIVELQPFTASIHWNMLMCTLRHMCVIDTVLFGWITYLRWVDLLVMVILLLI